MFDLSLSESLVIILGILAVIKYVLDVYKGISNPNKDQDLKIQRIEDRVIAFNEYLSRLDGGLTLIKENHLKHLEGDVSKINERLARFETMMDERLPKK